MVFTFKFVVSLVYFVVEVFSDVAVTTLALGSGVGVLMDSNVHASAVVMIDLEFSSENFSC